MFEKSDRTEHLHDLYCGSGEIQVPYSTDGSDLSNNFGTDYEALGQIKKP
jgi:hypothetical protein